MITKSKDLNELIDESDNIAILSGAGVSTLSGIPDFRGESGLYTTEDGVNPQKILSRSYFNAHKALYWNWHLANLDFSDFEPNSVHEFTKRLEDIGKLRGVITQNVDGLYQKAGVGKLIEIHGNSDSAICVKCKGKKKLADLKRNKNGKFICENCNFPYRPTLVLYEDTFDTAAKKEYDRILNESDLLIVMGTGLDITAHLYSTVYFEGKIALVNNQPIDLNYNGVDREWALEVIDDFVNIF